MSHTNFINDVALSFSGNDRLFVEKCANILTALGIKVFYDFYEESELWGKDLFPHLAEIYTTKAKYVIVFVSKSYKEKKWTSHELKFICQRAFEEKSEYILPVMMDETKITEIPSTLGYLKDKSPFQIAVLVAKKINKDIDVDLMLNQLEGYLPDYRITIEDDLVFFKCESEDFQAHYPLSFMMELYKQNLIFDAFVGPSIVPY